ncbi:MAG: ABC transporter ATP-binding protein [Marinobacter sp.]|uniref:ABC transporter ATP-binding protein n=1 Tax=Marinobacter sp. TaxID=50741 RepID=UPI0034A00A4A
MTTQTLSKAAPGKTTKAMAISSEALSYAWSEQTTPIKFPDIQLAVGEHLFLQGASGSGKSTLLALLSGLAVPLHGTLGIMGQDLPGMSSGQRDRFRADHLGVIFQQFNLVPYLSVLGNVLLPCHLSARRRNQTLPTPEAEAETLLTALNIAPELWHRKVTGMSVGQQQRVAAARALIGSPALILADEPTSALDADNRDRFIDLLLGQAETRQTSVVFVSHDQALAPHFRQHLMLETQS